MFIVLGSAAAIFLLTIYSGRVFGYKCLGMLHFLLGYITNLNSHEEHVPNEQLESASL